MTATLPRAPERATSRPRRSRPLWVHAAALAAGLVAVLGIVGPETSYSADEGAAILQARSLARGDGWSVEHPLPAADPAERWYPLDRSEWGEDGIAPYAKHPLYPVLLAGADRVGGVTAMVLLSVGGTVAAALGAAALALRLGSGLARPTLWAVGVGSPLLFDGFLVIAHSLAAAAVALAMLAVLRAVERRRARWALLAGLAVAVAVALRTEAVFVALALSAVAVLQVARARVPAERRAWAVTAGAVGSAAAATLLLERLAQEAILGPARPRPPLGAPVASGPFLTERWDGFVQTWLRAGTEGGLGAALGLSAAVFAAIAVWASHRRTSEPELVRGPAVLAAALLVGRAVLAPPDAITGLLMACPLLWVGLAAGGPSLLGTRPARLLLAVSGLAALGVLGTQYRIGGAAEWGGRYFALLLPLVLPVAVAGVVAAATRLDLGTRRVAGACLVVGTAALAVLAVRDLEHEHDRTGRALASISAVGVALPDPVIVTTEHGMARFAWATFDEQRWLAFEPADGADLAAGLRRAGVGRFVLVSEELPSTLAALPGVRPVAGAPERPGVLLVELDGNTRSAGGAAR